MDILQGKDKWKKRIGVLLKVEIYFFIVIIIIAVLYYNYKSAHEYFNRSFTDPDILWYQKKVLSSMIVSYIYGLSFFVIFIFPFIFLIQIVACIWLKVLNKRNVIRFIVIVLLYFCSMLSTFLLYSIGLRRNILMGIEVNESVLSGIKQEQIASINTYSIKDFIIDDRKVRIFGNDSHGLEEVPPRSDLILTGCTCHQQ